MSRISESEGFSMPLRKTVSAAVLFCILGSVPAVLAAHNCNDDEDMVKSRHVWWKSDKSTRHETRREEGVTIRTRSLEPRETVRQERVVTYGYVEPEQRRAGSVQVATGPYRYVFVGPDGQYDYYLDHYGYPYAYGGTPMNPPPPGVSGYVPPEQAGGGPAQYYRHQRPVSWSARRSSMGPQ